jgi:PilZ domain-containing protein
MRNPGIEGWMFRMNSEYRYPVAIPVTILRQSMPEVRCYSVNISNGGMAISTFVPLSAGEDVRVQFTLPNHKVPFLAESKICWWKAGPLGIRFGSLSRGHQSELQGWLSQKLEEMLPESVAAKFQKAIGLSVTASRDTKQDQTAGPEVSSRPTTDASTDA